MKNLNFEDYADFAEYISDVFENRKDKYDDVSVIAKYKDMKEIFCELVCMGYDVANIDLELPLRNEYKDEFVLSLDTNGIWIDKFKRDGKYLDIEVEPDELTTIFILDNCSSQVIPHCQSNYMYEVNIGDNDENDYDDSDKDTDNSCDHICEYIRDSKTESVVRYDKDDDGDLHGFSASKSDENGYVSYSYYSSDELSKKDVDDFLGKFGFRLN